MTNTATDGGIYHNGRTYAEHCAWSDSLVGDEYRIVHMAIGHLFNLAIVSSWKRVLLTMEMSAGNRLQILDGIGECIFGPVTAEAIARIDPIDEVGQQMLSEICSLPIEKQTQAFSAGDVFRLLAKLNPSLLSALRLCKFNETAPEQPRNRTLEAAL
jgi:hypothetical protein